MGFSAAHPKSYTVWYELLSDMSLSTLEIASARHSFAPLSSVQTDATTRWTTPNNSELKTGKEERRRQTLCDKRDNNFV